MELNKEYAIIQCITYHIYVVIEVFVHVSTKNKELFSINWMKSLEHKSPYKRIIYSDI